MSDPFTPGARVEDLTGLLGRGTVQPTPSRLRALGLIVVLWDADPPRQYNAGQNPCGHFACELVYAADGPQ